MLSSRTQNYLKVAMADEVAANEVIQDLAAALAAFASFSGQVSGMTTNIVLTANSAGTAGNSILLTGDGTSTVAALITAWNSAHPSNQVSLTSGSGTQIPANAAAIALAGGAASARFALSARTQDYLKVAMADEVAASEVIAAVISQAALSVRTKYYLKIAMADRTAAEELITAL